MLRTRASIVLAPLFFVIACSGHVAAVDGADASASDAGSEAAADAPVDTGVSCAALEATLAKLRDEARTCCPVCNSLQCNVAVEDVCCPISVTAQASQAFVNAVAEYKAKCHPFCPASPCPPAPSNDCVSLSPGDPTARGVCR